MKYLFSILLIAFLSGCSLSTGTAAKKIGSGVSKCCSAALCVSPSSVMAISVSVSEAESTVSPTLLYDSPGQLLTW